MKGFGVFSKLKTWVWEHGLTGWDEHGWWEHGWFED